MDIPSDLVDKFSNKWWRLNNLYYIINESGNKVLFKCTQAQEQFFDDLWYFNVLLKARQWGGTTFTDLYFLDECLFNDNLEAGIVAHNKDDAKKIFRRKVQFPYAELPEWIKKQRPLVTDSQSELAFSNGSVIYVATSVRSATVQLLHISEYGIICQKYPEKAEEIFTGSLNAVHPKQIIIIESTAKGSYGYFYDLCKIAQDFAATGKPLGELDYRFHFVAWFRDPKYTLDQGGVTVTDKMEKYFAKVELEAGIKLSDGQRAWYVKKFDILGEKMYQEFPSTPKEAFMASVKGAYFPDEMLFLRKEGRLTTVPYDPSLPVNTGWDLGVSESNVTSIVFHQRHGLQNRLIDYYQNHSLGLAHYAKVLADKKYVYDTHYLPHDIDVLEIGTGKTRLATLKALMPGQTIRVVDRIRDIADGIEAIRSFLPSCWFDVKKTDELIRAVDNYKREWDKKYGVFRSKPLHNWATNPIDALRTLLMGYQPHRMSNKGEGFSNWKKRSRSISGGNYKEYYAKG